MDVSDARRLKTLEDENARLKELLPDHATFAEFIQPRRVAAERA